MNRSTFTFFLLISFSILLIASISFEKHDSLQGDEITRDTTFLNPGNYLFNQPESKWVKETIAAMTLEEKIGQLIIPQAFGTEPSDSSVGYQRLKRLVEEFKVGGFIFFKSTLPEQSIIINRLQRISKLPLLMSSDFEHGVGMRISQGTNFPSQMALGAANDSLLAYEMGRIIGKESRRIGINQNYAPVVDINNNPDNPIINTRSIGEDPVLVTRLAGALVKGMQDEKLIATLKHFPGHGNTSTDSHNKTALIETKEADFANIELYPFRELINQGVLSIMVGHIQVPNVYEDGLPATISEKIVSSLLKNQLKFAGLTVTDAMSMHAISKSFSDSVSALLSIKAGCDLILFPEEPEFVISSLINSVRAGLLPEERINHSLRKLLRLKEWAGLSEYALIDETDIVQAVNSNYANKVAFTIAKKSITLAKDTRNSVPLQLGKKNKYYHLIVSENNNLKGSYFDSLLRVKSPDISTGYINKSTTKKEFALLLKQIQRHNNIIVSVYNSITSFKGTKEFDKRIKNMAVKINRLKKNKILLSHSDPYITGLFPSASAYVLNYGDSKASELAMLKAIFGENQITGKLPVSIPSAKLKRGMGIMKNAVLVEVADNNEYNFESLDSMLLAGVTDSAAPGMATLVMKDGDILYKKNVGHFTYDPNSSQVTDSTIYDLASVSKVIGTTTAAMICYDRKLFSLDDKVSKYIPKFKANGKENITIRNLMVHNSGLPAFKKYYEFVKNGEELLADIYNSELIYPTGSKMVYSDLGMITLQKIIEKVTGKRLDVFLNKEVFKKLGMTNTMYKPPVSFHHRIAPTELDNYWRNRLLVGEVHDEAASMLGGIAGHAGLFSNTSDLAVFLQMLLQGGEYGGHRFIKEQTVEMFTTKQSDQSTRGIGWDTRSDEGSSSGQYFSMRSFGHTGYTGTSVWVDKETKVVIILLTNRVHPTRDTSKLLRFRPKFHDVAMKALGY